MYDAHVDILSHALWGGIAAATVNDVRRERKPQRHISPWWAAFWGVFPDLFAFGPAFGFAAWRWAIGAAPAWGWWMKDPGNPFVDMAPVLYRLSHSLVVFAGIALVAWLLKHGAALVLLGWPLHILMDIPTHTSAFYATPFLWPLSRYQYEGTPWTQPEVMLPNLALLALSLGIVTVRALRRRRLSEGAPSGCASSGRAPCR